MIDYIELDESRPIKFGMNALRLWTKDMGITLNGINAFIRDPDMDGIIKLLYYGLRDGARYEKKEYTLSLEETCDLADDMDKLTKAFNIFLEQYSDDSEEKGSKPKKKVKKSS